MSTILELTSAQLKQAADIKEKIEALNQELNALLGGASAPVAAPVETYVESVSLFTRKRVMSAAGKARIAAAQRARWAKVKAGKAAAVVAVSEKPKRKG